MSPSKTSLTATLSWGPHTLLTPVDLGDDSCGIIIIRPIASDLVIPQPNVFVMVEYMRQFYFSTLRPSNHYRQTIGAYHTYSDGWKPGKCKVSFRGAAFIKFNMDITAYTRNFYEEERTSFSTSIYEPSRGYTPVSISLKLKRIKLRSRHIPNVAGQQVNT